MRPLRSGRSAVRRALTLVLTSAAVSAAVAFVPGGVAGAASPEVYVAMGDSYSAGSGNAPLKSLACTRFVRNYPSLVAATIHPARFRDVTCGGATTANFTNKQFGFVPPQYNALTAATTLVTVGIGGNDIGLVQAAVACGNLLPPPYGSSCQVRNGTKYEDKIDAFAATYGVVVDTIHARSPLARVFLVGYPTVLQPGGCYPKVPVWPGDADYVQSLIDRLNLRMAQQAAAHGATYVDIRTSTIGHDACQPKGTNWIEGLVPTSANLAVVHPNALGEANMAVQVLAHL